MVHFYSAVYTTEKFYSTVDESHLDNVAKVGNMLLKGAGAETTDLFLTFSADLESNKDVASQQ